MLLSVSIHAQGVPADFAVTLQRTNCFGACPVYSVTVDAIGNVTYVGEDHVRIQGHQVARISSQSVAALFEAVERIAFFELDDRYLTIDGAIVTDLPTTLLTVTRNGQTKRIEDYLGAPDGLRRLEREIDSLAGTLKWLRIDAETLSRLLQEKPPPSLIERANFFSRALNSDDVEVLRVLLKNGIDPNGGWSREPPLLRVRSAAATKVLLEAGANPSGHPDYVGSPLDRAAFLAADVTDLLIRAGARVNEPVSADGRTALWQAACNGNISAVMLLIKAGADVDVRASNLSAIDCARQNKADPFRNSLGRPPFFVDYDAVVAALQDATTKKKQ